MATASDETSAPGTAYTIVGFGATLDWKKTWFVEPLPNNASCSICAIAYPGLYLLPCMHLACWRCYEGLRRVGPMCALDRKKFLPSETSWITFSFDNMKRRKIHCWNVANGCKTVGPMCHIIRHFRSQCSYHSVSCPECGLAMAHRSLIDHLKLHSGRESLQHNHSIVPHHRPVCPEAASNVAQQETATSAPDATRTVDALQDVRGLENVNSSITLPVVKSSSATEHSLSSCKSAIPTNLELTKQGTVQVPQAEHVLESAPAVSNELPQEQALPLQVCSGRGRSYRRKRTRNLPASTRQLRARKQNRVRNAEDGNISGTA